jgi:hypothetical protein
MPDPLRHIDEIAKKRGITYPLLSDPANGFARTCGLAYELSPNHIRIHLERGRDFRALHDDITWRLPLPSGLRGRSRRAHRLCLCRCRSGALARPRRAGAFVGCLALCSAEVPIVFDQ